jgi:hypothetical protein
MFREILDLSESGGHEKCQQSLEEVMVQVEVLTVAVIQTRRLRLATWHEKRVVWEGTLAGEFNLMMSGERDRLRIQ